MKDTFCGQLDIATFLSSDVPPDLGAARTWRGHRIACDGNIVCALIGSPRLGGGGSAASADDYLQAWKAHGREAPAHFGGGHAVAIADAARRTAFLAVDRFAIETLCYRLDQGRLSFSDRADGVEGRGNELDAQALFDYLYFHVIPAPRTAFRQVSRLPAAHALLIDSNGAQTFRYWPLDFDEQHREPFAQARDSFLKRISDSVADEIAGEARPGAFLSGGTDSSTVAGMLCRLSGSAAPAYSIGFEAQGYDEMEYARIAAHHFGCEHHEYYVTPSDLVSSIPAVAQSFDQPFGNSSALPAYYCAKIAKADGCTKMLAGDGGDELFGGNSRYATQSLFELYHALPVPLRRAIEPLCTDASVLRRIPGLRQATGYVRHSRIPMPDRLQSFNLIMQLDPARVLAPDFLARVDLSEPSAHMRATWAQCAAPSLVNRMLAYDWRYTLADSDLPKVRGATALAGMPVAYPLLSNALTDFSMTLQPDWKVRRYQLRWFFKQALRDFLPAEIITKKKQGFGLPFGVWTVRTPALQRLAEDSLRSLADRGLVRHDFVSALFAQHLPEHPGYYGEMVWILMMLEQWLRAQPTLRLPD